MLIREQHLVIILVLWLKESWIVEGSVPRVENYIRLLQMKARKTRDFFCPCPGSSVNFLSWITLQPLCLIALCLHLQELYHRLSLWNSSRWFATIWRKLVLQALRLANPKAFWERSCEEGVLILHSIATRTCNKLTIPNLNLTTKP